MKNIPVDGIVQPVLISVSISISVSIDVDGNRSICGDIQIANSWSILELIIILFNTEVNVRGEGRRSNSGMGSFTRARWRQDRVASLQ